VEPRAAACSCAGVCRLARQAVVRSRRNASGVAARAAAAPTPGNRLHVPRGTTSGGGAEYSRDAERSVRGAAAVVDGGVRRTRASRLRAISDTSETSVKKPSVKADAARGADTAPPAPPSPASGSDAADETNQNLVATAFPLVAVGLLVGIGAVYKEDITDYLRWFAGYVEGLGPNGPALFMALYVLLEVLAVPAIPLTLSAGAIFGPAQGTAIVSVSGTIAATASFFIARYALRDRVKAMADQYPKFAAIDRAIGEDSFRVVALLRLSPLLPFALSNYLYGLTSVKAKPYVLASWLGMLPGTFAYVSAGSVGRTMMEAGAGAGEAGGDWTHAAQIACGFGFALLSGSYVAKLASEALKDVEEEMDAIEAREP
jgi:uncharacterized membrane protein YdjX (TVP38/TMEM64 family)